LPILLEVCNMALIGLVGFIGSGKGTVADILTRNHGFIKESFANAVKDAVAPIFGWDRTMLEGDTPESRKWRETPDSWWSEKLGRPFSPRIALQLMGTESGRNVFHTDVWVLSLLRRINPNKNYVLADVRFPNEIDLIRSQGGKVVRVKRGADPIWMDTAETYNWTTNWDGTIQQMKNYPDVHYSEWAWVGKGVDDEINNSTTLGALEKKVANLTEA
jgi:hypothetical protein